jgi:hypothetical protein
MKSKATKATKGGLVDNHEESKILPPTKLKTSKLLQIIEENPLNRKQSSMHQMSRMPRMSSIIKEDISYDFNIPPAIFTYNKIVKMFYSELLKTEAIKLENNAKAIAEEIAIKIKNDDKTDKVKKNLHDYSEENIINAFIQIIKKKIDDCRESSKNKEDKELLRKTLWDVLYKANFGYVATYKTLDEYPDKTFNKYLVTYNIKLKDIYAKFKQDEIFKDFKIDFEDFIKLVNKKPKNGGMPSGARSFSPGRRSSMLPAQSMSRAQSMPSAQSMDNEFYEDYFSQQDTSMMQNILQKIKSTSNFFIIPWKNLCLKVYKELWFNFTSFSLHVFSNDPWDRQFPKSVYIGIPDINPVFSYSRIDEKRIKLRDKIIESYKNDLDKQAIIKEKFEIIDNNDQLIYYANKSIYERLLMDWRINFYKKFPNRLEEKIEKRHFKKKYWRIDSDIHSINQIVYRPFDDLPIYGMRLGNRFDRFEMLCDMLYLFRNIPGLKVFVNLNDCETISADSTVYECNPYDIYAEREIFEIAAKAYLGNGFISKGEAKYHNSGIIYLSIKNFENMKAGNLLDWYQLSKIPRAFLDQRIIINSSNGKKTTGTILLFLRLRDAQKDTEGYNYIKNGLIKEWFGHNNGSELLSIFKDFFINMKVNLKDVFIPFIDEDKKNVWLFNIDEEFKEVIDDIFNTEFIWHVKLLRQRLNRIFYFLAKKHNIKKFYLYTSRRDSKYYQPTYDYDIATENGKNQLFFPFMVNIDWENIGAENWSVIWKKHQNWVDGIQDSLRLTYP